MFLARWHVNYAGTQARWQVDHVGTQARMARDLANSKPSQNCFRHPKWPEKNLDQTFNSAKSPDHGM